MSIFRKISALVAVLCVTCLLPISAWAEDGDEFYDDFLSYEEEAEGISDPLEPMNRFFFQFNDKMYFYVLKPVSRAYSTVLPEDIRICVRNAFHNLLTPVRVVNNLLQGKFADSGTEVVRFVINTISGAGGLGDPAQKVFHLESKEEDLGQTLGSYGVGEGIYFCWPFLGPSNFRDTIGYIGDSFLNPITYLSHSDMEAALAAHAGKMVNKTSLNIGEYEQFIEASFDPYIAMRDFYTQNRRSKIKDEDRKDDNGAALLMGPEEKNIVESFVEQSKTVKHEDRVKAVKGFFVQVGSYSDCTEAAEVKSRLVDMEKESIVVEYLRGEDKFYGVMVPGGQDFVMARLLEQDLNNHGFSETVVISR